MTDTAATSRLLADPDHYVDGVPHELLADLRRRSPVVWQEMDGDQQGFFAVLSHAAVVAVSRDTTTFSAAEGGIVLEDTTPERLAMSRDMLVAMDPPRHVGYRKPLAPNFKAKVMAAMEPQIRAICRAIMAEAAERGPDVEFVHDVAAGLPSRVTGQLMGLPQADWPHVHQLAERMMAAQDPDLSEVADSDGAALLEMAGYAAAFAADRRQQPPRPDLTTVLLGSEFDGRRMSDADFASFFVQLVGAGNDTTKTLTSSALVALLPHPAAMAEVRADPSLAAGTVEETLRWANPVHYMRRTAVADAEIAGVKIGAGQKVAMYYTAANRDDAVFEDPDRYDIHRNPNPHLAFGIGEHFCLGVHLARLEGRVFLQELLAAFGRIELAGTPERLRSNFNNAYKRVPVRLTA